MVQFLGQELALERTMGLTTWQKRTMPTQPRSDLVYARARTHAFVRASTAAQQLGSQPLSNCKHTVKQSACGSAMTL